MPIPNSTAAARTFCQRLQLVAFALMGTQIMLLIFGWKISQSPTAGLWHDRDHPPLLIPAGFAVGILLIAVSFFVARRPAASFDQYIQRFFRSFVFAEIGALMGLALGCLFGAILPLLLLAAATAASIYANYLSIVRRVLESHELNSPQ